MSSGDDDGHVAIVINTVTGETEVTTTEALACDKCGFFSCVCTVRVKHQKGCRFRLASTCAVGIECDHGYDVCPLCDPCTCEGGGD